MHSIDPLRFHFKVIESNSPHFYGPWADTARLAGVLVLVAILIAIVLVVIRLRGGSPFRTIGSGLGTLVWTVAAVSVFGYWADGTFRMFRNANEPRAFAEIMEPRGRVVPRTATLSPAASPSPIEMIPFCQTAFPKGTHLEEAELGRITAKVPAEPAMLELPDWVKEGCQTDKDGSRIVIVSQQFATPEESRRQLFQLAVHLVRGNLGAATQSGTPWTLPDSLVRSEIIHREHIQELNHDFGKVTGKMYRVYWELRMSPRVREKLFECWREQVVQARVSVLGAFFGMIALIATSLAGYFILDSRTRGTCRGRLKLAAATMVVAGSLLAPLLLSQLSPVWSRTFQTFPF